MEKLPVTEKHFKSEMKLEKVEQPEKQFKNELKLEKLEWDGPRDRGQVIRESIS